MSLSIHINDYFTREQKSSKADFHASVNVEFDTSLPNTEGKLL